MNDKMVDLSIVVMLVFITVSTIINVLLWLGVLQ